MRTLFQRHPARPRSRRRKTVEGGAESFRARFHALTSAATDAPFFMSPRISPLLLRRGLLLLPGLFLVLSLTAGAEDMELATHGSAIDIRPLDGAPLEPSPVPVTPPQFFPPLTVASNETVASSAPATPEPSSTGAPLIVAAPNPPGTATGASAPSLSDPGAVGASSGDALPQLAANTSTPSPNAPAPAAASPNAMINLVNLLVAQHVITRDAGDTLIKQSEQEADSARAQIATTQAKADRALTEQAAAPSPASAPASAPASDDDVRVTYVPDVVKNQIRDEVTQEVLKQDRDENAAVVPKSDVPDWVKRFRVAGDIRVRYEGDLDPDGNSVGSFTNFNAINTGSGFVIGSSLFPQYNVDRDRNRFRLRARIGAEIDLGQGFTAGMRLGTGADNSPVTENQTLGGVNGFTQGQGGNFSKYAIWLDRAYIKYEIGGQNDRDLAFSIGRFDNPFFHTSMLWSDDLAFDGAFVQAKYKVTDGVTPFFTAGAFPVFDTDLNFSSTESAKFSSEDKYLFATQLGTNWTISKDFSAKVAGAVYYFSGVEGKVSDPITSDANAGNTDDSRPAFAQNGNTYIELRDYQDPTNPTHVGETQYFGLATPFHEFAATAQLDYSGFDPFHVWLTGEFVKNFAFDRDDILKAGSPNLPGPINNLTDPSNPNSFSGGDTGWNLRLNLGKAALEQLWDWNVNLGYRYVESDATVDGFTDSDFGGALAGTNLKGFTIGGNLALSPRIWTSLRWMSANAVSGPTYKSDVIQFDLNAKF
jgi:Putative porin